TGDIPNAYCDNKTKNCVSIPHGKLYLPVVEVVNDNTNFNNTFRLKDIKMDIASLGADTIFVYKSGVPVEKMELTIVREGGGKGLVITSPAGIVCGDYCVGNYEFGTAVSLFAVPFDSHSVFTGWSGDEGCDGTTNHISLQMNAAKTCTATFAPVVNLWYIGKTEEKE
ncbi:MAG: hypothetical protein VSS75_014755, partial [Candidatus Parabeggiatoa sp.]|nr:hypothetical protein [Candidatus Parabeggiatoa sp.]